LKWTDARTADCRLLPRFFSFVMFHAAPFWYSGTHSLRLCNLFRQGLFGDHVIVEYWNGTKWQLVEPQFPPGKIEGIDVSNVKRDQFVVAGLGWQLFRAGQADPDRFGLGPDSPIKGQWFLRG